MLALTLNVNTDCYQASPRLSCLKSEKGETGYRLVRFSEMSKHGGQGLAQSKWVLHVRKPESFQGSWVFYIKPLKQTEKARFLLLQISLIHNTHSAPQNILLPQALSTHISAWTTLSFNIHLTFSITSFRSNVTSLTILCRTAHSLFLYCS